MTKMDEFNHWGDTEVYWFPCEAGCSEYLSFTWDDEDPDYRFIDVCAWHRPRGFVKKIKYIWNIILGRHIFNGTVLLNETAVAGLREVLNKHA